MEVPVVAGSSAVLRVSASRSLGLAWATARRLYRASATSRLSISVTPGVSQRRGALPGGAAFADATHATELQAYTSGITGIPDLLAPRRRNFSEGVGRVLAMRRASWREYETGWGCCATS